VAHDEEHGGPTYGLSQKQTAGSPRLGRLTRLRTADRPSSPWLPTPGARRLLRGDTPGAACVTFGQLYPRMFVGVTAGLLDGRHHERLGAAWILFLWCCCRQTGQGEEGIVCRGAVITYADIAEEINCKRGTVREWMARLVEQSYVRVERDRRGIRVFVLNPKKFRVSEVQHSTPNVSVGTRHSRVSERQHSKPIHPVENTTTSETLLQNDLTKLLKNNDTTAASKPDAAYISSLNREKTMPRGMSQAELDARRREMLLQAERIKRDYPSSGNSPGRVATA
jgi:hypothetical protein